MRAPEKDAQLTDVQVPCPWRLCSVNSTLQNCGFIFHTTGLSNQCLSLVYQTLIVSQGEFAHRVVKCLFALTNKKDTVTQIATKYRREARSSDARIARAEHELELEQVEAVVPELHHNISHLRNSPLKLRNFLWKTPGDPAKKVGPHIEN